RPGGPGPEPRAGGRPGGVPRPLAIPRRLRSRAGIGPRLAGGDRAPSRGRRGPAAERRAATRRARGRGRPAGRRRRGGARGHRDAARAARGPRGARRPSAPAARGHRAHVLRRPVAVRDREAPLAAARYREVPDAARHAAAPGGPGGGRTVSEPRDHAQIEALLALRALGGIEPEDERRLEREMAAHGPDCPECRRLGRAHAEVAAGLAMALAPAELPAGWEDRVVAGLPRAGAGRRRRPLREIAAVAAAALLAFAAGWAIRGARAPDVQE